MARDSPVLASHAPSGWKRVALLPGGCRAFLVRAGGDEEWRPGLTTSQPGSALPADLQPRNPTWAWPQLHRPSPRFRAASPWLSRRWPGCACRPVPGSGGRWCPTAAPPNTGSSWARTSISDMLVAPRRDRGCHGHCASGRPAGTSAAGPGRRQLPRDSPVRSAASRSSTATSADGSPFPSGGDLQPVIPRRILHGEERPSSRRSCKGCGDLRSPITREALADPWPGRRRATRPLAGPGPS